MTTACAGDRVQDAGCELASDPKGFQKPETKTLEAFCNPKGLCFVTSSLPAPEAQTDHVGLSGGGVKRRRSPWPCRPRPAERPSALQEPARVTATGRH